MSHRKPNHGAIQYVPERDGDVSEYVKRFKREAPGTHPLFHGAEFFELLRQHGWLHPRISIIRLMHNHGRTDEHFEITEDFQLEGIASEAHAGREGLFEPKVILDNAYAPHWEFSPLFQHKGEE